MQVKNIFQYTKTRRTPTEVHLPMKLKANAKFLKVSSHIRKMQQACQ